MNSVIIGGGPITHQERYVSLLKNADLIVCADSGLHYLNEVNVKPDILLGDFDSVDPILLEKYKSMNLDCVVFPKRKDVTDSELAIDYVIEKKPDIVHLIGFTGKRLDHGLANLFMLRKFFDHGIQAIMLDYHNEIYYSRGNITLTGEMDQLLSIIPITEEVVGVQTEGLDYPLINETLYSYQSRGVSNVVKSDRIQINTASGEFFIILSRD